ncbi:hypothetical protein PR048_004317 [Dryococelus australis]|uniref:Uncharacterized protein n=1 Tax=Dryococelus australis TaxID=614101 RepID=A0ABQ9I545_9NEOP|nr:hypothetical protein PR048_004317 [Dryococelus australis]
MASKVTVEGKELDLQEALNHLASRLKGLQCEKSDLKRQVTNTPVNSNGDRSDLSGNALMHVRNFTLLPTIPVFSGKPEDNAANVCNWSESEQLAFVKLRLASEALYFILDDSACQEAETYEEVKHLLELFDRKHTTLGKFTRISLKQTFKEVLESAINVVEADKHPGKEQDTSVKSFSKSVFAVERNGDKHFFCHKVGYKIKDCCKRAKGMYNECVQRRVNRARYQMLMLTRMPRDWTSHESQSHVKCIPAAVSGDDLNDLTVSVTYRVRPLKMLIGTGA